MISSLLMLCCLSFNQIATNQSLVPAIVNAKTNEDVFVPVGKPNNSTRSDIYENNNNTSDATNIFPENSHIRDNFFVKFSASLDTICNISDIDYYFFSLFTCTNVSIDILATNSDYSFDFQLFTLQYLFPSNQTHPSYADSCTSSLFNSEDTSLDKKYTGLLNPGTYYIYLRGKQPSLSNVDIKYSFSLSASKSTQDYVDQSCSDLIYNKQLSGAIWKSDYLPFGSQTPMTSSETITYYQGIKNANPDYCLDKMMDVSEGKAVHYATLYLWDRDEITLYRNLVIAMHDQLFEELKNVHDQQIKLKVDMKIIGETISIVATACNIVSLVVPAAKTVAKVLSISKEIIEEVISIITPEITFDQTRLLDYLAQLKWILNPDNCGIIAIPLYYSLYKNSNLISPNYSKNIIDFTTTMDKTITKTSFSITSDQLQFNQDDSFFCRGKIFGIWRNKSGTSSVSRVRLANHFEDLNNYSSVTQISLNATCDLQYYYKQYGWFVFSSPKKGQYSFYTTSEHYSSDFCLMVYNSIPEYLDDGSPIAVIHSGFLDGNGKDVGCYYESSLGKNQTLFFRLSNENNQQFNKMSYCSFRVDDKFHGNCPSHIHKYTDSYDYIDTSHHRSHCSCGASILENHVLGISSKLGNEPSNICSKCGGKGNFIIIPNPPINPIKPIVLTSVVNSVDQSGQLTPVLTSVADDKITLSYIDSQRFISEPETLDDIISENKK